MEALTALSVASSVIAFVDYGGKILSNAEQIYKSNRGFCSSVVDIETIANDVDQLTEGLRRSLPEFRPISQLKKEDRTEDDDALDRLCIRCHEIAIALLDRIRALQPKVKQQQAGGKAEKKPNVHTAAPGLSAVSARHQGLQLGHDGSVADEVHEKLRFSKWSSFKKALAASWNKSEMEEMAATLKEFQGEIEFRILISIRRSLNETTMQQSHVSNEISRSTQIILDSFLNARDELADLLRVQATKIIEIQEAQAKREVFDVQHQHEVLRGKIQAGSFLSRKGPNVTNTFEPASFAQEAQLEEELRILVAENEILGSLSFDTLDDRRESIDLPYIETFEWIYEEPDIVNRKCSNFVDWLRTGSGIYWINGKVGSGKSTLMRYIFENAKTMQNFETCAGDMSAKVYGFFFWRSGDEEQRSQRGLLRSLLYMILQGHRELIPEVLPDVWNTVYSRTTSIIGARLPPDSPLLPPLPKALTMMELKNVFRRLLRALENRVKVCLLIDGLDEYEGDYLDIVDLFKECAKSPSIKLCLSSRPLLVFEQAFTEVPGMRLQDLTRGDITQYVRSRLCSHQYMVRLTKTHPGDTSHLIDDIVNKSSGVFLWVKLVVRSLLRGLCDQNRISDLRARVEELPEDMEELYNHMLGSTDRIYYKQASRIFQIFRAAQKTSPSRVTLLHLSWADEENPMWAENAPIQVLQDEEISLRCEMMDARLKSICAGLLESNKGRFSSHEPDSKVMFLHRTVSDWISKKNIWEGLTSRTADEAFSPNLAMLKSRLLCLKSLDTATRKPLATSIKPVLDMEIISDALSYAVLAERELDCGFPKLLDQLDYAALVQWRKHNAKGAQNDGALLGSVITGKPHTPFQSSSGSSRKGKARAKLILDDSYSDEDIFVDAFSTTGKFEAPLYTSVTLVENDDHTHWSRGISIDFIKPHGVTTTFFELTQMMGLTHYLQNKNRTGLIAGDQEVNYHVLMHSIALSDAGRSVLLKPPNPHLVDRILEGGVDPNFSYRGLSPWENVLYNVVSVFMSSSNENPAWENAANQWTHVFQVFLEHGADPIKLSARHPRLPGMTRVTPMMVVEKYFPASMSERRTELALLLSSKIAEREVQLKPKALARPLKEPGNDAPVNVTGNGVIASWIKYILRL